MPVLFQYQTWHVLPEKFDGGSFDPSGIESDATPTHTPEKLPEMVRVHSCTPPEKATEPRAAA